MSLGCRPEVLGKGGGGLPVLPLTPTALSAVRLVLRPAFALFDFGVAVVAGSAFALFDFGVAVVAGSAGRLFLRPALALVVFLMLVVAHPFAFVVFLMLVIAHADAGEGIGQLALQILQLEGVVVRQLTGSQLPFEFYNRFGDGHC